MYIYFFVILVILFLGKYIKKEKYNICDFIIILILILVSGFRYDIRNRLCNV